MKKTYIAPEAEIVRLTPAHVIATSLQISDDEQITDNNQTDYEFNSNAFQGSLFDEE